LAIGTVTVQQADPDTAGTQIYRLAAAAFSATLAPQTGFGTAPPPLRVRIGHLVKASASADYAISATLRASAPGLCRITVRAGRTVVAQTLDPMFRAGATTVPIELTSAGMALLKQRSKLSVTIQMRARDVFTQTADVSIRAVLAVKR
jgi:hypothetical protein